MELLGEEESGEEKKPWVDFRGRVPLNWFVRRGNFWGLRWGEEGGFRSISFSFFSLSVYFSFLFSLGGSFVVRTRFSRERPREGAGQKRKGY